MPDPTPSTSSAPLTPDGRKRRGYYGRGHACKIYCVCVSLCGVSTRKHNVKLCCYSPSHLQCCRSNFRSLQLTLLNRETRRRSQRRERSSQAGALSARVGVPEMCSIRSVCHVVVMCMRRSGAIIPPSISHVSSVNDMNLSKLQLQHEA